MKHIYALALLVLTLLLGASPTWAKDVWGDSGSVQDSITKSCHLVNRRALAGPHCMVNRVFNTVSVATVTHNLDNLTDEDLTNTASFPSLVNVGLGYSPIVSVRDLSRHYAKGTTVGYRMVYSSGANILSLDLVHLFKLVFYRDGKRVGEAVANKGTQVKGVSLKLINIPGSDNMCFDIEAQAPSEFDEVELVSIKVLSADVASSIRLKYAYVGKGNTYSITKGDAKTDAEISKGTLPNLANYCKDTGHTVSALKGNGRVIDDDLKTGRPFSPLGLIKYGDASVEPQPSDNKELFDAGTTVGFFTKGLSLLNLSVGASAVISTYDRNGKPVESFNIGAGVLGLNVVNGGDGTIMAETTKPFTIFRVDYYCVLHLDVGDSSTKYGFVLPAPTHDHHCAIRLSANMNICDSRNDVQLYHNDSIPVTYKVVSVTHVSKNGNTEVTGSHATVDASGHVSGMDDKLSAEENEAGDYFVYKVSATAADGCVEYAEITRPMRKTIDLSNCVTAIYNSDKDKPEYEIAKNEHKGGSLISISDIKNPENLLDTDKDNYADFTAGLKIGENVEVVGVKTKNGESFRTKLPEDQQKDPVRVGFVAQIASSGIDLNLLSGYRIACYKNDSLVADGLVSQSDVLGLGLIGNKRVQKITLAITVGNDKEGKPIDFDEITLWSTGVLKLDISSMEIYYPFIGDGKPENVSECENPLGCDPLILNNANDNSAILDGASIDHNKTGNLSTADVATFMENLSNIVDGDLKTACTYGSVAKVGGGFTIAVNLGKTLDYRHQIGVVMDKPDSKVLNVSAGKWMTIETYRNGKATGDKKTEWKVLGADVLTMNEKQDIFLMNPKQPYDEIVITLKAVADVIDYQRIYGIVVQDDTDGDGVPDCKDEESCTNTVKSLSVNDVCLDDKLAVTFEAETNKKYYVVLADQNYVSPVQFSNDNTDTHTFTITDIPTVKPGVCIAAITDSLGTVMTTASYTVHPKVTKWKSDAISSEWDKWDNWTNGSPYLCTDVIIPSTAKRWPVITAEKPVKGCEDIHFMPGGAIENVFRVPYRKAWVDLGMKTGEQALFMAPLQETKAGDFFVINNDNLSEDKYFTALDETLAPENRVTPYVYQRVWKNTQKQDKTTGEDTTVGGNNASHSTTDSDGNTVTTTVATWSHAFNMLSQDYSLTANKDNTLNATCFSLSTTYTDGQKGFDIIRLPKDATNNNRKRTYYYYNDFGDKLSYSYDVTHSDAAYRFGYEALTSQVKTNTDTQYGERKYFEMPTDGITLIYTHEQAGNGQTEDGVFLVGNPMMSHLYISKFVAQNTGIKALTTWNGTKANTIVMVNGLPVGTTVSLDSIAPAQAFFVQQNDIDATSATPQLRLTYTADMFTPQQAKTTSAAKALFGGPTASVLRILASNDSVAAGTLLLQGSDVKAATILDSEVQPKLAVFTVSNGKAYDVQPVNGDIIPLGIIAKDSVKISFQTIGNFDLSQWTLRDLKTGFSYPLTEPVMLEANGTTIGRYVLTRGNATDVKEALLSDGLLLNVSDGLATVTSHEADLTSAAVYDEAGRLIDRVQLNNERQAVLHVAAGVNIVKVCRAGMTDKTYKVMAE